MGKGKKKDDKKGKSGAPQEPSTSSTSQESTAMDVDPTSPPRPEPAEPMSPECVVEEKQEEECEGLGLGTRSKKNKPRKKKPAQPSGPGPKPSLPDQSPSGPEPQPAGPGFPIKQTISAPGQASAGIPPPRAAAPAPSPFTSGPAQSSSPWQRPSTVQPLSPASTPLPTASSPFSPPETPHGRGRGRGQAPVQSIKVESSPVPQPASTSREIAPTTLRAETVCRYKIPDKIPGHNVRTRPVRLQVNYLPMKFQAIKVYRYDVSFKPDRPKKLLKNAYNAVVNKHFSKEFIAFDQSKNCFSFRQLAMIPNDGRKDFVVEIPDTNNRIITFEVSFKQTGIVDLGNIKRHMENGGSSLQSPNEEIQCVDVILRHGALDSYVKCGRQFFKRPANPINLSGGLEMWTGLFQSAIFTSHAFINVDVAHKGFPIAAPVTTHVCQMFNLQLDKPLEQQRPRDAENFRNFMKRIRVEAVLVGTDQKREFICNGIVGPPKELFFTATINNIEHKMSVYDYFAKEKKYKLRYPYLNCAWVGPKDKNIYYPLELLRISYGQPVNKQLNEYQLSIMVKQAATAPDVRKAKIEEVAQSMNYSKNSFFRKFGFEISENFFELNAKVIDPPALKTGAPAPVYPKGGTWNILTLHKPEALEAWGFMTVECTFDPSAFENVKSMIIDCGRQMGMRISPPRIIEFNKRMSELRNILLRAVEAGLKFMIIVINGFSKDAYHKVKQMAERDVGIVTQCLKENTVSKRFTLQTTKNILLKLNSKMMGINQTIDARSMPRCMSSGGLMVVGADVTHPSPDQSNIPSIAAVTASLDPSCFIYNIELSIQTPKKEMIVDFENMMFDHLKIYTERNKVLPRKIYVFRDGVSEGQFAAVMNCELAAIHRAYERWTKTQKPEILFLLVQKRHHTRFFLGNDNRNNVEPGTCVDTHIVHPKELDFYLVSHQALKGTARPTRYHAVCNDGKVPYDEVEQLTYYLCHLYSRCTRAVSYPTPTYYAHLACLRARSLTHGQTFDNRDLEKAPQRLRVLDKMLKQSRMFFV